MGKNIRILQLGKFFPPDFGGMETVIYDITLGLNERGIACDALCANSKAQYKEDILPPKISEDNPKSYAKIMRCASFGKLASTAIAPQMIVKLRAIIAQYDIIHIHLPDPMANLALFCANCKGKKIIIHWHSDIIKQKFLLKIYAPLQHWLLKRADSIIATTKQYAEFSPTLKPFREKICVIPIGIDSLLESPKLAESKIAESRQSKKTIFALGRLVKYKGFEYLIESMRYLPNFTLYIAGSGAEWANLQAKIKALHVIDSTIKNRIFLLGKIDECTKKAHLNNDSIFVLPSITRNEAFGVVQLEAMSAGMPVIATDIKGSGVSFVNLHNESGLIVQPRDAKAIAKAILRVMSDYPRFSKGAQMRYLAYFTKDKMIDKIIDLYDRI